MTEHLLALELGPVVQIIAAARKTRDLYFGSWMLSEIAKQAARKAAEMGGEPGREHEALIVPAPVDMSQLSDERFAMGDEILVRVRAGVPPRDVAKAARQAAHERWLDFARQARNEVRKEEARIRRPLVRDDAWGEQTQAGIVAETAGEVVEVYAAWVPLTDDYGACLWQVKRLLFGRTACRNFPPAQGHAGIPKSSLDGRRETVLVKPRHEQQPLQNRKLRLNRGEQLDALGITKRVGDGAKNFPSTARLAAEPWIFGAAQSNPVEFKKLVDECEKLAVQQGKTDPLLGRVVTEPEKFPSYPSYHSFPFEGAILFENRQHEFTHEAADDPEEQEQIENRLEEMKAALKSVIRQRGEPGSYYVALVADGDRIGEALRKCRLREEHREFSLRLSQFAGGVRAIVDRHRGALIFAAGEDVSALLPLDTAIACADDLRRRFAEVMNEGHAERQATLSVGLAIGHFLDALEDTLAAAREMESVAKQDEKNALAVQYRSRGGAPIQFWASWTGDPRKEIDEWISLLRDGDLPDKVAYDIRRVARLYETWPAEKQDEIATRQRALQADLARLLSRKRSEARRKVEPLLKAIACPDAAIDLAHRIIIAGVIQEAQQQAKGGNA